MRRPTREFRAGSLAEGHSIPLDRWEICLPKRDELLTYSYEDVISTLT